MGFENHIVIRHKITVAIFLKLMIYHVIEFISDRYSSYSWVMEKTIMYSNSFLT